MLTLLAWVTCGKTKHEYCLTLLLPESFMETRNVVITFESVDEILWRDHSNELSFVVLSHGTICFAGFGKLNLKFFLNITLASTRSERAN